jgi:transforming growth factor-beta-induced protein
MRNRSVKFSLLLCAVVVVSSLGIATPASAGRRSRPDIVDVVLKINAKTGEFSTLIAALSRAQLVDALRGGPFTVFAPTNAAFDKLGLDADAINGLTDEEFAPIVNILLYHVTEGRIGVRAFLKGSDLTMLNGATAELGVHRWRFFINQSRVQFGLPVSNGVIYVIDTVLIPTPVAPSAE